MKSRITLLNLAVVLSLLFSGALLPFAPQAQARVVEPAIQQPAAVVALPLVDDFEAGLPAGQDGTVPIGFNTFASDGSTAVPSTTDADPAPSVPGRSAGNHVLKLDLNVIAWAGVTHSFEDAGATAWITQDWSAYEGISFYLYGTGTGTDLFVDVLDNRNPGSTKDDAERWSIPLKDDFTGWKLIEIPFASMNRKEIGNSAPNDGFGLTEVHGWAFGTLGTGGAKSYYLDDVLVYGVAAVKPLTVGFNTLNYPVTEGGAATITAKLSRPYTDTVTVDYATTFGLAVANRDYTPASGTLTFPASVTEQSFTVQTIDDAKFQGDRGVLVELSNPTGSLALGMPPLARVNILDNELYYPPLLDDFETYPHLWSADAPAVLANPEIAAGDALALPGQGAYEHVLQVGPKSRIYLPLIARSSPAAAPATRQSPANGVQPTHHFGRTFPIGQDWSAASALSFWYYGRNSSATIQVALTNDLATTAEPASWQLVWNDEFNDAAGAAPDAGAWGNEIGDGTVYGIPGWGNDELEYYTPGGENAATDGQGNLVITTEEADGSLLCYYGPCKYTSARLLTKNRFEVAYGRVEARVKVPVGAGLWPAFWMLGTDIDRVGWPQTGEIDIMEHVARLPNEIFGTLHGPGYSGGNSYGKVVDLGKPVADEFHTYAVEWQPDKITWFLDGNPYFTATPADEKLVGKEWVYNHPFYMLLNVAVGGNFGGAVSSDTVFPQQTLVDYVRLYQAAPEPVSFAASFVDDFAGWQQITLPFTAFEGAPGTTLDLAAVRAMSFDVPSPLHLPVLLDQVRLMYDDTTPPAVEITSSAAGETATGPVTFTFTFSEDVGTSFTAAGISVTGGTAGAFTRVSGTLATLVVMPPANAAGTMTVGVAAGKFYDAAYNANTEAASLDQAYDTTTVVLPGLPITFDDPAVTYILTGFGGADGAVVADPAGGANKVAEVTKSDTAQSWAGVTVSTMPDNSLAPIPFTATEQAITVRVWSPAAGVPIRLKVEDAADATKTCETEALTTVAGAWETLTFDFGAPVAGTPALNLATTYNRMSVFPNFGQTGGDIGGASTYYFDDFALGGAAVLPGLPITFDDPAVTYTLTGFGGADGAVVADPAGGANKVAEVTKSDTAQSWAGVTVSTAPGNSLAPIPFTATEQAITVRVWSPAAGVPIRLKVEDAADATKTCETEALTTVAGAWETLTFDFGAPVAGTPALNLATTYNRMSVFPNFGQTGGDIGGASTYYFDDFALGGAAVLPGLPITFDDPAVTYTLTGFGGADGAVVTDPAGGANKVAEVTKSDTAQSWAGVTVSTAPGNSLAPIPFTATERAITVRVWSPAAGVPIRLKVEDAADATKTCETEALTTVAGAWETLTFDFGAPVAGTPALNLATTYNRMSVFPNFGQTGGDIGGASTYYFDDFALGGAAVLPGLPITFDDPAVTYTLTGFGGAEAAAVVTDPAGGANKVAEVTKSDTAQSWAGVTVSTAPGNSLAPIPFTATEQAITVRVWSPAAGVPIRLKVEDAADATKTCETEALTTVAGAWETLTFDFGAPVAGTPALNLATTYNRMSVFPNFGQTGGDIGGASTYYFDDFAFGP